jgi:phospholipid/cholesterol/gamma-HCH transport system substrate-binding protein
VLKTQLAGHRGEAVLQIDSNIDIASDATATVAMSGLIGGNYVSIGMGTAGLPPLMDGAEIRTVESPDLNTIMAQLGGLGKELQSSLGSFSSAFNGDPKTGGGIKLVTENTARINATMENLQQITDKINRGDGTIGRLLNDPKLHDELLATVDEIKSAASQAKELVANAQAVIAQVKSGQGALGTLVYDKKAADDIKASIADLRTVSDKIARGEGTLGKLISDDALYNSAQITLKKADRALDGLNDSGPITAVGIVANALF